MTCNTSRMATRLPWDADGNLLCRRPGCPCPHTDCDAGWVPAGERSVAPCPTCRPEMALVPERVPVPSRYERDNTWDEPAERYR